MNLRLKTERPLPRILLALAALALLGVLLVALWSGPADAATTFTVNKTGDASDRRISDSVCDTSRKRGKQCTLRAAMEESNDTSGADTIRFNIGGTASVKTISPASPLPAITEAVTIKGYTQPGARVNTLQNGSDAVLKVQLNGTNAGTGTDGLVIAGSGVRVSGLAINRFGGSGIEVAGAGAGGNTIDGNFIGTNAAGNADLGNVGTGIQISGSPGNTIGGTTVGARNVVSGNGSSGVVISGASGNTVAGNFIGTSDTGNTIIGADGDGVRIENASNNAIGGTAVGARNVLSGNGSDGVEITGTGATGNTVAGNFIGTNAAGNADLGNISDGVQLTSGDNNTVGGQVTGARNIISGNGGDGVLIESNDNAVQGNRIGTDKAGNAAIGNANNGVRVFRDGNLIGGTLGGRNVISGNGGDGVELTSTGTGNDVLANLVGTDAAGNADLGNAGNGVVISSDGNTVGGALNAEGNTISGNDANGVLVTGSGAGNAIRGNLIGTNAAGSAALGNTFGGVAVFGADNTVGGTVGGAGNTISGNEDDGVLIFQSSASGNRVQGNLIGTDAAGNADLGNASNGVRISVAPGNTVGGTASGARNVISGNGGAGVNIGNAGATGNVVQGNRIGTNKDGNAAIGNTLDGVLIIAATNTAVGGTVSGAGNTISGNGGDGVSVQSGGTGNHVLSNSIAANGGLGLDLSPNGVTNNDTDDPDTGANNLQNFPFIESAIRSNSTGFTTIAGRLNSNPSQSFTIQCFVAVPDGSGHGEGQILVEGVNVTTDAGGDASFSCVSPVPEVGQAVTATATNTSGTATGTAIGDTSEFSQNFSVVPGP